VGTRDLSSRRTDAHPRAVHRLRALVALIALGAATPALAAGTDVVVYKSNALATQPELKQPNFRLQNFMGRLYNYNLVRGGFAGLALTAGSKELSGAATAAYNKAQAISWADRLTNAGKGAFVGGLSGCGTGLAVGALPAAITGGVSMAAGCAMMGISGAIMGALNGGLSMPLDEGGTISVDQNAQLIGDAVAKSIMEAEQARSDYVVDAGLGFGNAGSIYQYSQERTDSAFAQMGLFRKFPCGTNSAGVMACMFQPFIWDGGYGFIRSPFASEDSFRGAVVIPSFQVCGSNGKPCPSENAFAPVIAPISGCVLQTGRQCITVTIEQAYYPRPSAVPGTKIGPVDGSGGAAVGHWNGQLTEATKNLRVSSDALAAYANAIWKKASDDKQPGVPPFNPQQPITKSDVDAVKAEAPSAAPRVGDLVRPYDTPGQEPEGTSASEQKAPPIPVVVTNPSTGTGEGAVKEAEPETELDNDDGLLGDVMKPAKDFLTDTLAPWLSAKVELPAAACPVVSIDLPTLLGRQDISNPQDSTMMCDWMEAQRPKFLAFLHVIFIFLACRKAMEA
jgi:hypothetical protein